MVSNPSTKAKTETIDEVILRLLGLKPGAEIDYQTYFEILKKKLAIARLAGKELPREEDELLREELKRVRRVKDKGTRIKIKEAKTKVASVGVGPGASPGSVAPKTGAIIKAKTAKIVPQSITSFNVKDVTENKEEKVSGFGQIKKTLDSILGILSSKFKFDKKQSETDRKEKETEKRAKRESGLEGFRKGISAVSGAAKKLLAPFQSIIDRIWRFIFFTLLGRAFTQLMEWLGDSQNKKKIEVLGRFLKDWWPTLLGAAILFFTPFGSFVRKTLSIVGFFTGRLVKLIPKIASAVKGLALNPWFAVPAAAVGLAAAANEVTGQRKAAPVQAANKARAQTGKGLGVQGVGGVGDMGPTTPFGLLQGATNGGPILKFIGGGITPETGYNGIDGSTGQKVSGFGPDTQMIVAQPGEIVMNKKTVDAVGADNLLSLNRQYGGPGANKPKMGKIQAAAGGGLVLQKFQSGGMVGMQGGSNRSAWDALPSYSYSLPNAIGDAQERLLNRRAQKNTNIDTNIRPWWDRLNPFVDRRKYLDRLPLNKPIEKYKMPGFDLKGWGELKGFRENPSPVKPNPKNPKIKYAPYQYEKPGVDKPLMLQGGGEVEALERTYKQGQRYGMSSEVLQTIGDEAFLLKHFGVGGVWRNFKGSGATDYRGNMIPKKQGGGEVEALEKTYKQGQMSGANPEALKAIGDEAFLLKHFGPGGVWRHFKGSGATDYRGNIIPKKQGGGAVRRKITESTGIDIPGATADRQLVALEPGEHHYIVPKGAVQNGAITLIDKIVAMTDPDSNPAKLGYRSKNVPNITPLSRGGAAGMGGMITLPPITQSASGVGNVGNSSGAGSRVPVFSVVSASGMRQQQENASMYGIVG